MSARGIESLVFGAVGLALLFALIAFAKLFLSDAVATFIAGLGLGAFGVLGVLVAAGKLRRSP